MNTGPLDQQITDLIDRYYDLIGAWHHKDRDCHWEIDVEWSYGNPQEYVIYHFGYLYDEIGSDGETHESYEAAQYALIEHLKKAIEQERVRQVEVEGKSVETVFGPGYSIATCHFCGRKFAQFGLAFEITHCSQECFDDDPAMRRWGKHLQGENRG